MIKKIVLSTGCLLVFASAPAFAQLACESQSSTLAAEANLENQEGTATAIRVPRDLKRGQSSALLPVIRSAFGLPAEGGFDADLQHAVKEHQAELGFTPSGVLDANTFMNVVPLSAQYRAHIAEKAADECRRVNAEISRTRPSKFVEVNVASQTLTAYEMDPATGEVMEVLSSRVVVGAAGTQTPLDDFNLWGLKFNPGWTPTSNILSRNVVKGGSVNKRWLASHRMRITDANGNPVSAGAVTASNWRKFRYHEPAGPGAALGVLKFETSSNQNIYMHDTPEKSKFDWNVRLASSGCVRVQEIDQLARWAYNALDENTAASKAFDNNLDNAKNTIKRLPATIPVYLTYRQVEFDAEGHAVFYADGYNRAGMSVSITK